MKDWVWRGEEEAEGEAVEVGVRVPLMESSKEGGRRAEGGKEGVSCPPDCREGADSALPVPHA